MPLQPTQAWTLWLLQANCHLVDWSTSPNYKQSEPVSYQSPLPPQVSSFAMLHTNSSDAKLAGPINIGGNNHAKMCATHLTHFQPCTYTYLPSTTKISTFLRIPTMLYASSSGRGRAICPPIICKARRH